MIWKDIPGYNDHYQASSCGLVRSKDRLVDKHSALVGRKVKQKYKGRILSSKPNADGYVYVHISVDNIKYNLHVGRAVLLAFKGEPPSNTECCHNDGDPSNNSACNLRWDTHYENNQDRVRHGTYAKGSEHPMSTLSEDDVIAICDSDCRGVDLAARYGVHPSIISDIRNGRIWKHITDSIDIKTIKAWKKSEKLNQEKADEIRILRSTGASLSDISHRYSVSISTASSVCKNKTWVKKC